MKSKFEVLQRKKFTQHIASTLSTMASYLRNYLPFKKKVVRYSKYCQPGRHQHNFASKTLSWLAFSVDQVLGKDIMKLLFNLKDSATEHYLCDIVRREAAEYQTEILPQEMYMKNQGSLRYRNLIGDMCIVLLVLRLNFEDRMNANEL